MTKEVGIRVEEGGRKQEKSWAVLAWVIELENEPFLRVSKWFFIRQQTIKHTSIINGWFSQSSCEVLTFSVFKFHVTFTGFVHDDDLHRWAETMIPFNVRARTWLFIIKSSFSLFFLFFPSWGKKKKTFEKCSCHNRNGCYPYFESLELGGLVGGAWQCAGHRILMIEMREAAPLTNSHLPTLFQQHDHSQINRIIVLENV